MFHMSHKKPYKNNDGRKAWQDLKDKVLHTFGEDDDVKSAAYRKMRIYNDMFWGLSSHDLPEVYV
jgi:hypothetical protein